MLSLRLRRSRRRPGLAAPGYAMPLAIGASGLLLLGSFALHGIAMQESLAVGAMERQQREEDLLASAAHKLLARLNNSHRCLLNQPLAQWEEPCATPAEVAALKDAAQVMDRPVQLRDWLPEGPEDVPPVAAKLALQLVPGRQAHYEVILEAELEDPQQGGEALALAARQRLALLNSSHRCLLNQPLPQWEEAGATCATPAEVAALKNVQVNDEPFQLVDWQPVRDGQPGQLKLQPEDGGQSHEYDVILAARLGPKLLGGLQP